MNNGIITIFTDGSSRGNPGPGGWGAIVVSDMTAKELGGREDMTTNNRMELLGAIESLNSVDSKNEIVLYSDSQYVIKGMTEWIVGWQKKGWKNSQKKAVLNRDLWERLLEASDGKKIKWTYVKGHAENPGNNRCDEIATTFADGEPTKLYNGSLSGYSIKIH
ncbi:MAG: ribonuclease [Patescibacteria group bacterium]|nr:ribonuclease [Patescibacteria group bacterium]